MEKPPKFVIDGQPTLTTTKLQPKTTPRIPTTTTINYHNQPPNNQGERKSNLEDLFSRYMGKLDTKMKTQDLALRKLDTKIDQVDQ